MLYPTPAESDGKIHIAVIGSERRVTATSLLAAFASARLTRHTFGVGGQVRKPQFGDLKGGSHGAALQSMVEALVCRLISIHLYNNVPTLPWS